MRVALLLLCALCLAACGGSSSDDQTSSGSTGGAEDPGGESCEGYAMGDSCIDESNFAQCQDMAAQCPGAVQVMESCPLQFACPSGSESPDGDTATSPTCNGHAADEQCMGEDAFAQCQEMEAQCPGAVSEAESCPLQFSCP